MARIGTTISCRAFAVAALLLALLATRATAATRVRPTDDEGDRPKLPLAQRWSIDAGGEVASAPVSDGTRVYLAMRAGHVVARRLADGKEVWRKDRSAVVRLASGDDRVFVAAGDAIEALRGSDGGTIWSVPAVKPAAPLVATGDWLFAITAAEILAIRASDGVVAWRHDAAGVTLAPAIDEARVYLGAADGRVLALSRAGGAMAWEEFLPLGITAIAAHGGRLYAGAGDKQFYCLDGGDGSVSWQWRVGSLTVGSIAADQDRVYFAALDNVVRGLDRGNGNQRWQTPLRERPGGTIAAGRMIFVPVTGSQLRMLFDRNGLPSGNLGLPGESVAARPPHLRETAHGLEILVVTTSLANEWQLTMFATAPPAPLVPFSALPALPGLPYLTDPQLEPMGRVLRTFLLADPVLLPPGAIRWPIVLTDPPLVPLTTLPGLQMRPLSPVLPVRRGGRPPGA